MADVEDPALRAIREVYIDPTAPLDSVWRDDPHHVDGMHPAATTVIRHTFEAARGSHGPSVQGLVIQGQQGSGKTHLLGQIRRQTAREGFFVLAQVVDGASFWSTMALAFKRALERRMSGPAPLAVTQLARFLDALGDKLGWPAADRAALRHGEALPLGRIDELVMSFRSYERTVAPETHDVLRALVLLTSPSFSMYDLGDAYLQSMDLGDRYGDVGLRPMPRPPMEIVRALSTVLALVGPQVIALDQFDALIHGASHTQDTSPEALRLLEEVAGGLMDLKDNTRRALTVVSCLPASWQLLKDKVVHSVAARFQEVTLRTIPSVEVATRVIERRLAPAYAEQGFEPPYPTWPIRPEALQSAPDYTARKLISAVQRHLRTCLTEGRVVEMTTLDATPTHSRRPRYDDASDERLAEIDRRFEALQQSVGRQTALAPDHEDLDFPPLLHAALQALAIEVDTRGSLTVEAHEPTKNPALHGRLIQLLDQRTERQRVWSFRALHRTNALSVQSRLQAAATTAGVESGSPHRFLVLIRDAPWPGGKKTRALLDRLQTLRVRTVGLDDAQLRVFAALAQLLQERPLDLPAWLRSRTPASATPFFDEVLTWAGVQHPGTGPQTFPPPATPPAAQAETLEPTPDTMPLGRSWDGSSPVGVPLAVLRKHTVIFAGSGSGKTVVIRRMVEEAALRGISSIVLDPNNDLARLTDAWPETPSAWESGDAESSAAYLAQTDVVVWTPRRTSGRPLTFQPLPDFAAIRDDPEALQLAIDTAVAALAPRAMVSGTTAKHELCRAILRTALQRFATREGTLSDFLGMLAELPEEVTQFDKGPEYAAAMADTLRAARINDPLFGGDGEAVDPGVLLRPADGKRARVSVISFVGLPDDLQRQAFVNQLQMALFAWARRHPTTDAPLGGLLVMDEAQNFAPSGKGTPCTESTLALASQARKYGLGLVFATQAPKGLHNRISGNATTQLYGKLQSPTQISAAKEIAASRGGDVRDIGHLGVGEFYVTSDELPLQKVRTRLCLTHHPPSPLTEEEVIARAQGALGS